MRSPVRALFERRSGDDPSRIPTNGSLASTPAGIAVSERTALAHIAVYRCVALIADAVSMLPVDALRRSPDGSRVPVRSSLVEQPNSEMTNFEFWQRNLTAVLLRGNTINVVTARDALLYPTQLTPVHPDDVRKIERVNGRRVYSFANGQTLDQADVMHVPGLIRPGEMWGMSPIEAGKSGIGLSIAAEQFGARWFGDGATPSSILESDENLTPEDAAEAQTMWVKAHGDGHRKPAVLGGGLKWRQIQVTPNESQFLETRRYSASEIASLYRIPPHMVGDVEKSTSWGSGIEEQGIGFVVFTLGPWLTRFEQALSALLPRGQQVKFNVSALLRGNAKDRMLAYAVGRQWGWLSVNDIRALEDMQPLTEGGDIYLQPLNMIDAEQALDVLLKKDQGGPNG